MKFPACYRLFASIRRVCAGRPPVLSNPLAADLGGARRPVGAWRSFCGDRRRTLFVESYYPAERRHFPSGRVGGFPPGGAL